MPKNYHEYISLEFTIEQLESYREAGYDLIIHNGELYVSSELLVQLALDHMLTKC